MSKQPLYKLDEGSTCLQQQDLICNGNAGLYFDKFCNTWSVRESKWMMDGQSKLEWIDHFTKQQVGTKQNLQESTRRLMWLIRKRRGHAKIFKSEYRFVTGLGRSHPVENGFTWHPTLGTPYLPGSSIKGLVRSWAEEELGSGSDVAILNRLLGSPKNAGSISFLDAIPTRPVTLEADVMTPHYAGWSKTEPPGDWRSPTPIPFLVMTEQTSLLFGIIPHDVVEDGDLDRVVAWLKEALAQSGGGAKTAVGYGRFGYDDEETSDWQSQLDEEQRQAEGQKSPEGRWRLELEKKSEMYILDCVRKYLQKDSDNYLNDDVERHTFTRIVSSDYKSWIEKWRSGKKHDLKTNLGKKKLKERAKMLDDANA